MSFQIVIGEERHRRLRAFGFSEPLIAALNGSPEDPIASQMWVGNGEVLAELVHLPYICEMMPSGTVIPVCQLDASSVHYVLLVLADETDAGQLLEWADEFSEPIAGAAGFLADALQRAREAGANGDALVTWAQHMGFPV